MPNHCSNDLWLHGPKDEVAAALAFIGADQEPPAFDFSKLLPYPAQYAQMDEECAAWRDNREMPTEEAHRLRSEYIAKWGSTNDGFNSGGYDWCVSNWGTKWGAYDVEVWPRSRGAKLRFDTAWSPPNDIIFELLLRHFPKLRLTHAYYEQGMGYKGRNAWRYIGGELVQTEDEQSSGYTGNRGG